jgi:hypothetical protein
MATRSTIALDTTEGFMAIYCHWDGYPDGVGATLKSFYSTFDQVKSLIEKGDLSSLCESLESSVFYTSRGEELRVATFKSESEWLEWGSNCGCEYAYLFKGDQWKTEAL